MNCLSNWLIINDVKSTIQYVEFLKLGGCSNRTPPFFLLFWSDLIY